jgi:hypothetical protein
MKKLIIAVLVAGTCIWGANAQGLSIQGGLNSVNVDVDYSGPGSEFFPGSGASDSELGILAGVAMDFDIGSPDDRFALQLAALLSLVSDLNSLYIPAMVQYELNEKFKVMAGPQINFILSDLNDAAGQFGLDVGFGAQYDIDATWYVFARYAIQVMRGDGDLEDFDYRINSLMFGAGFRLDGAK